jgi:energy-coupling factor transport system permease protein
MDASKIKMGLNYVDTDSPLHRLSGVTKFLLFIYWISLALLTFDYRIIASMLIIGIILLTLTRVPFRVYRPFAFFMLFVVIFNAAWIFIFSPNQGEIYIGGRTVLFVITERYTVTQETLWYLLTVASKYLTIFPMALVFILTTHPTEFAASLSRLKVPYKIAYAVSLALRYLPEVSRDFVNIMHAQQARGVDLSKKASLPRRFKNVTAILIPLILSSLDKTDTISNAMELRGFGRMKNRTWYNRKPLGTGDYITFILMVGFLALYLYLRMNQEGMFWYPF